MLRWLSKQVNWAGLLRDQDRWIEGLNERGEAETKRVAKGELWSFEGMEKDGWMERDGYGF